MEVETGAGTDGNRLAYRYFWIFGLSATAKQEGRSGYRFPSTFVSTGAPAERFVGMSVLTTPYLSRKGDAAPFRDLQFGKVCSLLPCD